MIQTREDSARFLKNVQIHIVRLAAKCSSDTNWAVPLSVYLPRTIFSSRWSDLSSVWRLALGFVSEITGGYPMKADLERLIITLHTRSISHIRVVSSPEMPLHLNQIAEEFQIHGWKQTQSIRMTRTSDTPRQHPEHDGSAPEGCWSHFVEQMFAQFPTNCWFIDAPSNNTAPPIRKFPKSRSFQLFTWLFEWKVRAGLFQTMSLPYSIFPRIPPRFKTCPSSIEFCWGYLPGARIPTASEPFSILFQCCLPFHNSTFSGLRSVKFRFHWTWLCIFIVFISPIEFII
jgi:hypothetical protein